MTITSGLMSSNTDDWGTPIKTFDTLNREFGFTLDVCASDENHKCDEYYTIKEDGLVSDWHGVVWCNPPYGRSIGAWVKKASEYEGLAVMLVPARTDTKWWHDYAMKAGEIRLIKGRLKFNDCGISAPFPSAILVFNHNETQKIISWSGKYETV